MYIVAQRSMEISISLTFGTYQRAASTWLNNLINYYRLGPVGDQTVVGGPYKWPLYPLSSNGPSTPTLKINTFYSCSCCRLIYGFAGVNRLLPDPMIVTTYFHLSTSPPRPVLRTPWFPRDIITRSHYHLFQYGPTAACSVRRVRDESTGRRATM